MSKTKPTIIPAGFRLSVTSWENDADNYKTEIIEGLTEERTRLLVDLTNLFTSKNDRTDPGFGNMYEPNDHELEDLGRAILDVCRKHPGEIEIKEEEAAIETMHEVLHDLGIMSGEYYSRVMESLKVEYVPTDIMLLDVTDKFTT